MGKKGLHNILEPAAHGIPIIIGKNYKKFPEANDLIKSRDCFSVSTKKEFTDVIKHLLIESNYKKIKTKEYVKKNLGASDKIFNEIKFMLEEQ